MDDIDERMRSAGLGNLWNAIKPSQDVLQRAAESGRIEAQRQMEESKQAFEQEWQFLSTIRECTEALRLDPDNADIKKKLASMYIQRGDLYSKKSYKSTKDYDKRIADYGEASRLDPDNVSIKRKIIESYKDRGWHYQSGFEKNYYQAFQDFDTAVRLDPDNADSYFTRGCAYFHKEDYYKAIADFEKVADLNPSHDREMLAKALAKTGGCKTAAEEASRKEAAEKAKQEETARKKRNAMVILCILGAIIGVIIISCILRGMGNGKYAADVRSAPAPAPALPTTEVTSDRLNVRSGPGTNNKVLKTLKKGDRFTVTGETQKGWMPVEHDGTQGWVSADMITVNAGTKPAEERMAGSGFNATHRVRTNDGTNLRLRDNPSFGGAQIGSLDNGSYIQVLGKGGSAVDEDGNRGNWMRVVTPAGISGWCFGAYLREIK